MKKKNYCDPDNLTQLILEFKKDRNNVDKINALYNELKKIIVGVIYGTKLKYQYQQDFSLKEVVELTLSHLFVNIDFYDISRNSFTYFSVIAKRYLNRLIYSKFTDITNQEHAIKVAGESTQLEEDGTDECILFNSVLKLVKLELEKNKGKTKYMEKQSYYRYQKNIQLIKLYEFLLSSSSYNEFLSRLDNMSYNYKQTVYKVLKGLL